MGRFLDSTQHPLPICARGEKGMENDTLPHTSQCLLCSTSLQLNSCSKCHSSPENTNLQAWGTPCHHGVPPCSHDKGVSKNRGTPKWMVYNGKPYENYMDLGGNATLIFGNTHRHNPHLFLGMAIQHRSSPGRVTHHMHQQLNSSAAVGIDTFEERCDRSCRW